MGFNRGGGGHGSRNADVKLNLITFWFLNFSFRCDLALIILVLEINKQLVQVVVVPRLVQLLLLKNGIKKKKCFVFLYKYSIKFFVIWTFRTYWLSKKKEHLVRNKQFILLFVCTFILSFSIRLQKNISHIMIIHSFYIVKKKKRFWCIVIFVLFGFFFSVFFKYIVYIKQDLRIMMNLEK